MKKQVLVTVGRGETRVAILESKGPDKGSTGRSRSQSDSKGKKQKSSDEWRVAELYLERPRSRSIVGNVYKGRVENVVQGLEAAFVDIGLEKNGFLHVHDIIAPSARKKSNTKRKRIGDVLRKGQDVVVQAVKDPLKTKGPRLSMQLAIPGRYMVYLPQGEGVGISRRLQEKERERLRRVASNLKIEKGGAIVRTAAQGAKMEELEREVGFLFRLQEILDERIKSTPAPNIIFQEADLPIRVVRDIFTKEFDRAIVDDELNQQRLVNFFKRTAPELADKVDKHTGDQPLFEQHGIEDVYQSTLSNRVDLPSGGYLIIDYTEAFTIIDVNTGSFTGKRRGRLEDTITKTNLEAAEEVVRQLRLRDIGGIIVIDFIDMEHARNRNQVLKALNKSLEDDSTKTYVMEISPLGLVEMTRENVSEGVREIMTRPCTVCDGAGVVLTDETIAIQTEHRLRELVKESDSDAFLIKANPRVFSLVIGDDGESLDQLERETGRRFFFEGFDSLPREMFEIVIEGGMDEVESRALPLQTGDEIILEIEDKHSRRAADGVAKIEGYRVTIANAAGHVGERMLVRIDEVAPAGAIASLIERESDENADTGVEDR